MTQATQNISMVAPALEKYARGPIADLWKRPGLAPRDRSVVTVAAMIARNQTIDMPHYFDDALNNGVEPSELSEIITHLAFYSGWGMPRPQPRWEKMCLSGVASGLTSSRQPRQSFCPSARLPKRTAPRESSRILARWLLALCSTRPTCSSATCGFALVWRRATEVSSRSARL
jgi:alkylhydroperoxidase/carboxymuconolactone decarboxylase family protein YurZ